MGTGLFNEAKILINILICSNIKAQRPLKK